MTRDLFNVFEVQDIANDVWTQLHLGQMAVVNGISNAEQASKFKIHTTNAFWMHYLANEDYSGTARCLINPPPRLAIDESKSLDMVTVLTDQGYGRFGTCIDLRSTNDGAARKLTLNSIRGEEKGFFNEVVVFCNGLIGRQVSVLTDLLSKHLLPQTTAFIFEVPNTNAGLWTSLFEPLPESDVGALIESIGSKTGFTFNQIQVKESGPRTTIFFGIDVSVDKPA